MMYVNGGSYYTSRNLDLLSDTNTLSLSKIAIPIDDTSKDRLVYYNKRNLGLSNDT